MDAIQKASSLRETIAVIATAHEQFNNIIRDDPPVGFDSRIFRELVAIDRSLGDLPTLIETAQMDLQELQLKIADAEKIAKRRLRCRRKKIFGVLTKILNYSACVLALGAVIALFTGVGAVASPVLAAGAALASAGAVVCTQLQGV